MSRVLILGIDSLDSTLLSEFEADLPNFRKLRKLSPDIRVESVFPPDSETAWASIYTGLNPAKHGIVNFIDPIERAVVLTYEGLDKDALSLHGNTFWDFAGKAGKKVCILFPHIAYPPWQVDGTMISRTAQKDIKRFPIQTFPSSISQITNLNHLNTLRGYPRDFIKYAKLGKKLIQDEAKFGLTVLKSNNWDLFFLYSSTLDWICHYFWMYFDENDPSYPGDNPYKNVIREFYKLHDDIVGEFLSAAPPDAIIIVLSDHGHRMRPTKLLNINQILKQKGLLFPKGKSSKVSYYLLEKLKEASSKLVNKYRFGGSLAVKLMHLSPASRRIYTSPPSIDWRRTSAYVSDLSGIKAYPYGGIIINKENLEDKDYEEVRSQLIKELSGIDDPNTGKNLMKWASRREELYSGEYITKYPDIVFKLESDYGAGWSIYGPLIAQCYTHNIHSGNHRIDGAVFLISNAKRGQPVTENITLMDIAPTVLHLLGIEGNFHFDGKALFLSYGK